MHAARRPARTQPRCCLRPQCSFQPHGPTQDASAPAPRTLLPQQKQSTPSHHHHGVARAKVSADVFSRHGRPGPPAARGAASRRTATRPPRRRPAACARGTAAAPAGSPGQASHWPSPGPPALRYIGLGFGVSGDSVRAPLRMQRTGAFALRCSASTVHCIALHASAGPHRGLRGARLLWASPGRTGRSPAARSTLRHARRRHLRRRATRHG